MATKGPEFKFSTFANPKVVILAKIASKLMVVIKYSYNQVLFVSLEHFKILDFLFRTCMSKIKNTGISSLYLT